MSIPGCASCRCGDLCSQCRWYVIMQCLYPTVPYRTLSSFVCVYHDSLACVYHGSLCILLRYVHSCFFSFCFYVEILSRRLLALLSKDIRLQEGSFHIDFMMTIRTEEYAFESTADALATFKGRRSRDCSPWYNETRLSGTPSASLGTGTLNTQNQEPNSAPFLSPTQFVLSRQQNANTEQVTSVDNLGISFLTLSSPTITQIQYQSGDPTVSPISYRVQGTGYFRPALADWPFDTQRLEVMLEDLDLTISSQKVSFVFCSLRNYSGLSPTVRFPDANKQLSTGTEITEMCWPPFRVPYESLSSQEQVSQEAGSAETCALRGGEFRSSRYTFFVQYNSPAIQRFTKTYLPVCMINFILAMSYVLDVADYSQRITICVGTLTALVLFHVSIETQLPSSETITLADWLIIYSYAMNLLTWATTIAFMLLHHAKHHWTMPLQRICRCCGPIVIVTVTIVVCSFTSRDYVSEGGAGGKVFGTCIGAIVLGIIFLTIERAVEKRCLPHRPSKSSTRRHPAMSMRMESMGGQTLRRRQNDYEHEDSDEDAGSSLLKTKESHLD
eukprot:m.36149 g.36149  ORF g.36149 m.36149 type:complete len:557 (+) comp5369_c0_seq1:332-2002(+)